MRFAPKIESGQNMARTKGAVALTETERRIIQISAAQGIPVAEIAEIIQRSPKTIYKLLAEERAAPPAQHLLPMGQANAEV